MRLLQSVNFRQILRSGSIRSALARMRLISHSVVASKMSEHILHLFPDTNIFIECRPLDQLDWSCWSEFDEVHLIVCRTVQREIDRQKNHHERKRVRNRARAAFPVFAKLANGGGDEHLTIRASKPTVKLFLQLPGRPSPKLENVLDYDHPDDEIIGHLYTYAEQHSDADVRLLTLDAGPTMSAKSLGLSVETGDDDWRLPPEHSDTERENARLKDEITKLRKTEPKFDIACVDEPGNEVEFLRQGWSVYGPLTDDEIVDLTQKLKRRHPIATDFGFRTPGRRPATYSLDELREIGRASTLANEEKIRRYNREYEEWIAKCRAILSEIHTPLQDGVHPVMCYFEIENTGTRPGKSARVEFRATGGISVRPPPWQPEWEEDESEQVRQNQLRFPAPPKKPRVQRTIGSLLEPHLTQGLGQMVRGIGAPDLMDNYVHPPLVSGRTERDSDAFYYTPDRPSEPVQSFALECELWRHGIGSASFEVEIHASSESGSVSGQIECIVHCENLTEPVQFRVPVTIEVTAESTKSEANRIIDSLGAAADQ